VFELAPPKPIKRRAARFLREPPSVRNAASLVVAATVVVVIGGAILMRVLDHSEYPTVRRALWWALQTVTTVGYGDVTPAHTSGRIVAAIVMLWGIAFIAILVAATTSSFVARAEREGALAAADAEQEADQQLHARFDELVARLEGIEQALSRLEDR
jgi:voltage-gated potassium channel